MGICLENVGFVPCRKVSVLYQNTKAETFQTDRQTGNHKTVGENLKQCTKFKDKSMSTNTHRPIGDRAST